MHTKTTIASVEISGNGTVEVKLEKRVILAGSVYSKQPHRFTLPIYRRQDGTPPFHLDGTPFTAAEQKQADRAMIDAVNNHVASMEFPGLTEGEIAQIEARVAALRAGKI